MRLLILPFTSRFITLTVVCLAAVGLTAANAAAAHLLPGLVVPWILTLALVGLGVHDLLDTRHAVLRNYPLAAHLRYILEGIRPAMRQYFFEDEKHGKPFSRDERAVVYQRAKMVLDKRPFGTQHEVYSDGFEWLNHSMVAREPARDPFRVDIGGPDCGNPYIASVLNISAMSFGALSPQAIRALNCAARDGGFAQDTGEGGVSPHHLQGGDLIWEIGSGYFGARTAEGQFCPARFADAAANPLIRMVELKLSQGAKPGHGGVLLAAKVSAEIAAIRGVPQGQDCISPSRHSADPVCGRDAAPGWRQARGDQAVHRSGMGVHGFVQGHAGNRGGAGFHGDRRRRGRHRGGAAGIHGSYGQAAAGRAELRA
jgi:hypothetical protein